MRKGFVAAVSIVIAVTITVASAAAPQSGTAANFIRENAPIIVLTHVELIDGTGAAPQSDQAVVVDHGKITAVGATASVGVPSGAKVIDATGKTVIPGIVGMHEHIF